MTTHAPAADTYYVPHSSPWPIFGSLSLFVLMIGVVSYLNNWVGAWAFIPGAVLIALLFFGWFSTVIAENERGVFNLDVDRSFRMGMIWFIISEVAFFSVFFGALFYARQLSVPWISGEGVKVFNPLLLWPDYDASWPNNGPATVGGFADGTFQTIPAFGLPLWNTLILLTSGVTLTIAHHALRGADQFHRAAGVDGVRPGAVLAGHLPHAGVDAEVGQDTGQHLPEVMEAGLHAAGRGGVVLDVVEDDGIRRARDGAAARCPNHRR